MPGGRYVVAVSGGVDSAVLLHMIVQYMAGEPKGKFNITVAHFDHGIRPDSAKDRMVVQKLARRYSLPFVYDRAELGAGASEAVAREARYEFLKKVQHATGADAIITAHHEDDVLETIIINWMRGTKSRGLSSLRSTDNIRRPLLGMTKKQIRSYAHLHNLEWREDSTNQDETYLRNYIRHHVVAKLNAKARARLLEHSAKAAELNDAIHGLVGEYLAQYTTAESIDRERYRELPKQVAREVLAEWLRCHTSASITAKTILRLDEAIRTGRNGSLIDIAKGVSFRLARQEASLASQ